MNIQEYGGDDVILYLHEEPIHSFWKWMKQQLTYAGLEVESRNVKSESERKRNKWHYKPFQPWFLENISAEIQWLQIESLGLEEFNIKFWGFENS